MHHERDKREGKGENKKIKKEREKERGITKETANPLNNH